MQGPRTPIESTVNDSDPSAIDHQNVREKSNPLGQDHLFNEQTQRLPVARLISIFLCLGLIDFIALLDQTTLAVSQTYITQDLHSGPSSSSLISSIYFLASTSCQLIYGRFSDIGRKPLLILLVIFFFVGSLGASVSPNFACLIAFRILSGIGDGGMTTVAQIIVSDLVSLRERGKYQAILGALNALANGVGPVIGGALTTKTIHTGGWRNIFRINLPVSALCLVLILFCMPLRPVEGNWCIKFKSIDWLGVFLSTCGSTLLVLSFTFAGGHSGWKSTQVIATLCSGFVLFLLFLFWQYWGNRSWRPALMPMYIFQSNVVLGAVSTHMINGWIGVSQLYLIPQFYQQYGYSATKAGSLLLPLTLVQSLASTAAGLVITWTGRHRELLLLGWAMWSIGIGLFSTLHNGNGLGKQLGFGLMVGIGGGLTFQPSLIAIQAAVPRKTMAVVTSTRSFFRNLGGALGVSLSLTIIAVKMNKKPIDETKTMEGFRTAFMLLSGLGALAFLIALFTIKNGDIDKDEVEKDTTSKPAEAELE